MKHQHIVNRINSSAHIDAENQRVREIEEGYTPLWLLFVFWVAFGVAAVTWTSDAKADVGYENAVACLALNVYHEAQFEPYEGRKAVAFVVVERMRRSGADACDIVFSRDQFSWTKKARNTEGGLLPEFIPQNKMRWKKAQHIARKTLSGEAKNPLPGATHYHAAYVKPLWAASMTYLGKIGTHLFYKER